jgi:hypothetical protein
VEKNADLVRDMAAYTKHLQQVFDTKPVLENSQLN